MEWETEEADELEIKKGCVMMSLYGESERKEGEGRGYLE